MQRPYSTSVYKIYKMNITYEKKYDVIVIGAGHAGCEAALAAARMGSPTLLLTMNLDSIAQMSCNPAIGGIAKGHIVREIDALGGEMAKITDRTGIQFRMLNKSKGPAVWAPRAQCDKKMYHVAMKEVVESQENLDLKQAEITEVLISEGAVYGVKTSTGMIYYGRSVIVTTGTFLNGIMHIGEVSMSGGRGGEKASHGLSESLASHGFEVKRLKTGTPPRLNARTIDFSHLEIQPGDENPSPFSFQTKKIDQTQLPCHITYTNEKTHELIRKNIQRSPLYAGKIKSRGPRYCPSIEDKIIRFADKDRHQLYLEPEGRFTQEIYVNGLSTSFPQDIQLRILQTIQGLENAEVMRFAYAIEYDFCPPTQLYPTLETKRCENLYFAGQINGTSGYEEAAGQGLVAAINAVKKLNKQGPFILKRHEAYIGVMIDDIVTNGVDEPYRMFTSRAEHRLLLRQDNADRRLMRYGHEFGLISDMLHRQSEDKGREIGIWMEKLRSMRHNGIALDQYLKRSEIGIEDIFRIIGERVGNETIESSIEIEVKYKGYIEKESNIVTRLKQYEEKKVPDGFRYDLVKGIGREAIEKLEKVRPVTLGQAARISGITPCDLTVLAIHIEKNKRLSSK